MGGFCDSRRIREGPGHLSPIGFEFEEKHDADQAAAGRVPLKPRPC
jgi:hypothetical protein